MARDKGQEIPVTQAPADVVIGNSNDWYTFINDGPDELFYRIKDENTMAGIVAVIIDDPIYGARLKVGEAVHIKGGTWEVVCATGLTSTLRIIPGRVVTSLIANVDMGANVGLLDKDENEIDPSEGQPANTAYAAADKLTPIGGVKSATRHTAAELETFADDDWVPVGVTAVHELRVHDQDVGTDMDVLITDAQAANTAYVAADRVTPIGGVKSATRHTAAELETFADDDWVPVGVTAVHELRVRDDDANTDLNTLITDAKVSNVAAGAADRLAGAGAVRKDTEALPEAVADGDWVALQVDVTGSLRVTDDTLIAATPNKASNVAAGAGDILSPTGIVRKDTRALPEAVADGDWVAAQATATGDVRVRDDDAVTILTAQALLISPVVSTGLAAVATTDAEWTSITLTANVVFADVSLTAGDAYMVAQTATPGDADTGAIFYAGIVYRIPCRGRTKIWIRRTAAANVTIHVTDYSTA